MMPTTAKASGAYLNSMLAVRQAIDNGFDEAILLDIDGNVSEGSGENLFIVRDGRIFTNGEEASILMGITRDAVIEIARGLGYQVIIGSLKLDDLLSADEAFFTGTAAEVTPIREVDGRRIGNGTRGPITERIQTWFFASVTGRDRRYQDWLRLVAGQTAQAAC
jgi:branched-chain amino acid aminotransferase